MAASVSTGPLVALGGLAGAPSGQQPQEYSQQIGPSIFWSGFGLPIVCAGANKDATRPGTVPTLYAAVPILTVNDVLVAGGATLATAASAVAGTPAVNSTTFAAGIAVGSPAMIGSLSVTNAIGLDIGLDKAASTLNSPVITLATPANIWRYSKGQWLAVAGAGAAGSVLIGQITALGTPANGQITLSVSAAVAQANCEIGLTNRFSLYGVGNPAPSGLSTMMASGMSRLLIPECSSARGVGITGVAGGVAGNWLIRGQDIFGQLQTELIAFAGGATTTYGKKTYDVFIDATPQYNDAHAYTIVTSDLIGLPIAVLPNAPAPTYTFAGAAYAGAVIQNADLTYPATQTTGDPRGAIQLTTKGPNAGASGTGPNGTGVLTVTQTISPLAAAAGNMLNPGPLFGVPPV